MRPFTNVKRDARVDVFVQKFDCVEDLTLRIRATRSRHETTNLGRQSLMDKKKLRWTVCALLKLVNSSANAALSPSRGDEFSRLVQSVFVVHSFHSF